ncbi:unnamed protein product [Rhizophagus irregularis]|nr:unnamed protein product [Rhizophagus irregularis]CAB4415317.1 unnamed protein product [Rhizophagus irregularis]
MSSNIFFNISLPSFIQNKLARITETSLFEHLSANISPYTFQVCKKYCYLSVFVRIPPGRTRLGQHGILLYSFRLEKLWLRLFFYRKIRVFPIIAT